MVDSVDGTKTMNYASDYQSIPDSVTLDRIRSGTSSDTNSNHPNNHPLDDLASEIVDKLIKKRKLDPRLRATAINYTKDELRRTCRRYARRAASNIDFTLRVKELLSKTINLEVLAG